MPSCVPKRTKIHNVVAQRNYILNTNTYNCLINFRFQGRNTCGYPANICSVVAPTIFQNQYLCAHTHIETLHMYIYVATVTYVDILIFLSNKFESLSDSSKIWHGATAHINHIVKTPNAEIIFTKGRNPDWLFQRYDLEKRLRSVYFTCLSPTLRVIRGLIESLPVWNIWSVWTTDLRNAREAP